MLPVILNNQLFKDLLNNDFSKEMEKVFRRGECDLMRTDIKESDKGFEIHVDLPGFKKEEINAELKDGYLTISTNKNIENNSDDSKYILRERYSSNCSRSFYVGENLSEDDIHASFENGILNISIPKKMPEEAPKKTINIK
ncbi:MAG: Hsp20/alpha crystallin family protein [Candidatus Mucispirillum faecigallinarum]|uniref:Hsp20/alpha crystallin family protein n=1 Tax=Candidatus Mucispirillum faecigallinarum TaxID=2838699 RepID=A0A9D2GW17_9BACT|nr:Hsp20/alpha crystallin family protein [Mucispirillum sp.]MDY5050101.1 Hsp20/alpha crystallin family protein [Candidatus Mucispirillum faecigallinarum]HIZ90060.1 Hsp20/alpha crystallin family protein [Candidatus Mucispirillum faecigallinarum]